MIGAGHTNVPEAGFNWTEDMVRRGSEALLKALWREHERILLNLRERGLMVRAPGEPVW